MGDFLQGEKFRDDADDAAACRQCRIGQCAHQPDIAAAIDQGQAASGEGFAHGLGRSGVSGPGAGI